MSSDDNALHPDGRAWWDVVTDVVPFHASACWLYDAARDHAWESWRVPAEQVLWFFSSFFIIIFPALGFFFVTRWLLAMFCRHQGHGQHVEAELACLDAFKEVGWIADAPGAMHRVCVYCKGYPDYASKKSVQYVLPTTRCDKHMWRPAFARVDIPEAMLRSVYHAVRRYSHERVKDPTTDVQLSVNTLELAKNNLTAPSFAAECGHELAVHVGILGAIRGWVLGPAISNGHLVHDRSAVHWQHLRLWFDHKREDGGRDAGATFGSTLFGYFEQHEDRFGPFLFAADRMCDPSGVFCGAGSFARRNWIAACFLGLITCGHFLYAVGALGLYAATWLMVTLVSLRLFWWTCAAFVFGETTRLLLRWLGDDGWHLHSRGLFSHEATSGAVLRWALRLRESGRGCCGKVCKSTFWVVLRVPTSVLRIPHAIVGDRCPGIAAFERYLYDEHWRPRYCLFTAAGLNDPLLHAEHEDLGDPEAAAALESSELSRVAARLEAALDHGYGVVRWLRRQCTRATHALGACCRRNRRRANREGVGELLLPLYEDQRPGAPGEEHGHSRGSEGVVADGEPARADTGEGTSQHGEGGAVGESGPPPLDEVPGSGRGEDGRPAVHVASGGGGGPHTSAPGQVPRILNHNTHTAVFFDISGDAISSDVGASTSSSRDQHRLFARQFGKAITQACIRAAAARLPADPEMLIPDDQCATDWPFAPTRSVVRVTPRYVSEWHDGVDAVIEYSMVRDGCNCMECAVRASHSRCIANIPLDDMDIGPVEDLDTLMSFFSEHNCDRPDAVIKKVTFQTPPDQTADAPNEGGQGSQVAAQVASTPQVVVEGGTQPPDAPAAGPTFVFDAVPAGCYSDKAACTAAGTHSKAIETYQSLPFSERLKVDPEIRDQILAAIDAQQKRKGSGLDMAEVARLRYSFGEKVLGYCLGSPHLLELYDKLEKQRNPYTVVSFANREIKANKQLKRALRDEARALKEARLMSDEEAIKYCGVQYQGRALLPAIKSKLHIADGMSAKNEMAAACGRHFSRVDSSPLSPVRRARIQHVSKQFAAWICRNTGGCDIGSLQGQLPKSWTDERIRNALTKAADVGYMAKTTTGKFFVKNNEALQKIKPRGISSVDDHIVIGHACFLLQVEEAMSRKNVAETSGKFTDYFLKRTIKKATNAQLSARFADHVTRIAEHTAKRRGVDEPEEADMPLSQSIDFGQWDARVRQHLRECEAILYQELFWCLEKRTDSEHTALFHRMAERLCLQGNFIVLGTSDFGRQSGDRGTSTLNAVINLILDFVLEWEFLAVSKDQATRDKFSKTPGDEDGWTLEDRMEKRENDSEWDFMQEGDDNSRFVASDFLRKHVARPQDSDVAARKYFHNCCLAFYTSLGMVWEPATTGGGIAKDGMESMLPAHIRMEFCSRHQVLLPSRFGIMGMKCVSFPKLEKALTSASISFSKMSLRPVAMSTFGALAASACNHPLLHAFALAARHFYARYYEDENEVKKPDEFLALSWAAGNLKADADREGMLVEDYIVKLRGEAVAMESDGYVREYTSREYPALTVEKQISLEQSCVAYSESQYHDVETAWHNLCSLYEVFADAVGN